MNPIDYAKTLTHFWTAQSNALMRSQEQAGKAMTGGTQAMAAGAFPALPSMPADLSAGMGDLSRTGQSLAELWTAAISASNSLAAAVPSAPSPAFESRTSSPALRRPAAKRKGTH